MRPRAGHGWTCFSRGEKCIFLIGDCHGVWRLTSDALKWPRCSRCRRPEHLMPYSSGLCVICYYYHSLPKGTFWDHKNDYLFPYNIGKRFLSNSWDRRPLDDLSVDWREYLKTQQGFVFN